MMHNYRFVLLLTASIVMTSSACAQAPAPSEPTPTRERFFVRQDRQSKHEEPPPHAGTGSSTAYRYFDDLKDAKVIFRKRALHRGASIGLHVLTHDEVYYVVSGRGELDVDGKKQEVGAETAVFMYEGANVGIRQLGSEDLVIIISYPPARP